MRRGAFGTRAALAATLAVAATSTGCVERRYTVRTDVPGTLVYANGQEIGATPISVSHTYYGTREFTLVADGYQTQKVLQPLDAPWWDNAVTDFFTENLLPVTLRDEREFQYQMTPAVNAPKDQVLARAEALRQQAAIPAPEKRLTPLQYIGRALGLGRFRRQQVEVIPIVPEPAPAQAAPPPMPEPAPAFP